MSKRLYKHVGWAVLVSELSHVFCCVIPTLVTVLSAFANIGLVVVAPDGILMRIHEALHEYEIPVIVFSGVMVVVGWVAHLASRTVDCHDTGCGHPPCTPPKELEFPHFIGGDPLVYGEYGDLFRGTPERIASGYVCRSGGRDGASS